MTEEASQRTANWLAFVLVLGFGALVWAAVWAIWTHPRIIPIIAVPALAWAFISWITHP